MREVRSRLRNRKGAILMVTAFAIITLVIFVAVVADVGRLIVQRNELQTGTDAAAHAGALELVLRDSLHVPDSAVAFGQRNSVIGHLPVFPTANVTCGVWDPTASTFTTSANSGRCGDSANAVRVAGNDSSQYLFKSLLTAAGVQVVTSATAWAANTVESTSCIRPWGIPYWTLTKRLDPTNPDTTRDLTAYDIHQLTVLPASSLMFSLKVGSPTSPGNFGPLSIGGSGGSQYRTNISTCSPVIVGPDTVLYTETGNMVGPTTQGAADLCQPWYANGACGDGKGGIGMPIKVPLWVTSSIVNGKTALTVKIIGSFTLDTVTHDARVVGTFLQLADEGSIGTTKGTLVRVVLVQ